MRLLQIPSAPTALPDSVPDASRDIEILKSLPFDELIAKVVNAMVTFAINLAIAVVVFYVGRFIINKIYNLVHNIFEKRRIDQSLNTFVLSMIRIVLYFILIVTVIGILGIETSSFLAIFASAGVAIGMALSGTLQNFAGGVLILLLKPYKIGDYIEAQGYAGTVREIQIFSTIICTADNKSIIIPNGGLSTGSINNWSKMDYRRVEWTVGISYGNKVDAARAKILEILDADPDVVKSDIDLDRSVRRLEEKVEADRTAEPVVRKPGFFGRLTGRKPKVIMPDTAADEAELEAALQNDNTNSPVRKGSGAYAPSVVVKELGASSVDLRVTAWTQTGNYWNLYYRVNEQIYTQLESAGISFPFPQLDVHVSNQSSQS